MLFNWTRSRHSTCDWLQIKFIYALQTKSVSTPTERSFFVNRGCHNPSFAFRVHVIDRIYPGAWHSVKHKSWSTNIWQKIFLHGFFPKSLSTWIFKKHRKDAWLVKFSVRCVTMLHKMRLERCAICHESTNNLIRVEDYNTLKSNVINILEMYEEISNKL